MRAFDYEATAMSCIDNEIVNLLIEIHERNVKLNCILESDKYDFSDFAKQANLESIISSVRMDYAHFSERLIDWLSLNIEPFSRDEKELCGYRDNLDAIFKAKRPRSIEDFRTLHEIYKEYDEGEGYFILRYNNHNVIKNSKSGASILKLEPVDFKLIDDYINEISLPSYSAIWNGDVDFLLVLPICILDFIKTNPLHYTSMQMSRLLMLAMLWGKNYQIGKYISLERIIEDSSDEYYRAIADSIEHWEEGHNDYKPFVKYILQAILKAYKEFEKRTEYIVIEPISKPERVEQYIMDSNREITKREIMHYCPDISETTIEVALRELKNAGKIEKIGGGRYTRYKYRRT